LATTQLALNLRSFMFIRTVLQENMSPGMA